MANDRRVTFIIQSNISNFSKGLKSAQRQLRNFGRDMQRMGRGLTMGLTLPIVGAGTAAVKTAAEYETLRQSIDIMTGSAAEGARVFERLKRLSAGTPFQLKDIARANQTLMGFGQTADEAFESIKMIGDIAAVTGGDMQAISVAFGQAAAEGKLMTRDIRQLINQGVPAIQLLADSMNVATSEVLDLASQGEITFDVLTKAFREATSDGGMFADGMKKQSNTIAGVFSTLRDNVSIAMGEVGESISDALNLKGLMRDLTGQIQRGVEWFKALSDEAKRMGVAIAGLLAVIGPTLLILGKLVVAISALMSPAVLATAAITALFAGVVTTGQWFVDNWGKITAGFRIKMAEWENAATIAAIGIIETLKFLFNTMTALLPTELAGLMFGWDTSEWIMDTAGVNRALDGLRKNLVSNGEDMKQALIDYYEKPFTSFGESAGNALELAKNSIVSGLKGILNSDQIQDLLAQIDSMLTGSSAPDVESKQVTKKKRVETFRFGTEGTAQLVGDLNVVGTTLGDLQEGWRESGKQANAMRQQMQFATGVAREFTNSFGRGMANIIVQGDKLLDTFKNIGRLLASSVIQRGISALLTGGLGGTGFFGAAGGLIGSIFGVNDALIRSDGSIVKFHPNDDILAMQDFSNLAPAMSGGGSQRIHITGEFKQRGSDLVAVIDQTVTGDFR